MGKDENSNLSKKDLSLLLNGHCLIQVLNLKNWNSVVDILKLTFLAQQVQAFTYHPNQTELTHTPVLCLPSPPHPFVSSRHFYRAGVFSCYRDACCHYSICSPPFTHPYSSPCWRMGGGNVEYDEGGFSLTLRGHLCEVWGGGIVSQYCL